MWQCKECGKRFSVEPIYCDFCGATEDFLEPIDEIENENFYKSVEQGYRKNLECRDFEDYDKMIKDFLADEYQPVSRKVKEPFEDEMIEKAKKKRQEKRLESLDNEYYESIKTMVGTESIEKDDYYNDLEEMFKDPIHTGDQTTFNGIFKKNDTIENTFLKPKGKKGRTKISNIEGISKPKKTINIPMPNFNFKNKGDSNNKGTPKDDKKLIKTVLALGSVFVLMVILMFVIVGNIVDSGDESGKLPKKDTMMKFFIDVNTLDEASFLENPTMISFMGYEATNKEKQDMLKTLYNMVTSEKINVDGVEKIEQKGINRVLVTYKLSGDKLYVDTFEKLLFRTSDYKTYQLDFTYFVTQYTISKEVNTDTTDEK